MTAPLPHSAPTPDWMLAAACRGKDPDLWHAPDRSLARRDALAVCARCHVADECLDHAVRHRKHDGIWGGRTPEQRRDDRRRIRMERLRQELTCAGQLDLFGGAT